MLLLLPPGGPPLEDFEDREEPALRLTAFLIGREDGGRGAERQGGVAELTRGDGEYPDGGREELEGRREEDWSITSLPLCLLVGIAEVSCITKSAGDRDFPRVWAEPPSSLGAGAPTGTTLLTVGTTAQGGVTVGDTEGQDVVELQCGLVLRGEVGLSSEEEEEEGLGQQLGCAE